MTNGFTLRHGLLGQVPGTETAGVRIVTTPMRPNAEARACQRRSTAPTLHVAMHPTLVPCSKTERLDTCPGRATRRMARASPAGDTPASAVVQTPSMLLDVRGAGCADVLIRLAALARATDGPDAEIIVWTDDRGAPTELPAWCRMTRHRFDGPVPGHTDRYLLTLHPSGEPR